MRIFYIFTGGSTMYTYVYCTTMGTSHAYIGLYSPIVHICVPPVHMCVLRVYTAYIGLCEELGFVTVVYILGI